MRIRRLLSTLRKRRAYLFSVPGAVLWAWWAWEKRFQPSVDDTGTWFDLFAKVFMTGWTTLVVFVLTLCLILAVEHEMEIRKSVRPKRHRP